MNEQRNFFIIFFIVFAAFWGYEYFFPKPAPVENIAPPKVEKVETQLAIEEKVVIVPKDVALREGSRISIDTPSFSGSINLIGARFDDITLKNYEETVGDRSPNVDLLNPENTEKPFYVEFTWVPVQVDTNPVIAFPTEKTEWASNHETLKPNQPIRLTWTNPQGIVFERHVTVDEDQMFTVTEVIRNTKKEQLQVYPKGRIVRVGEMATADSKILHEGVVGYLGGKLQEVNYADIEDVPAFDFASQGGWLGITDKYWMAALAVTDKMPITAKVQHFKTPRKTYMTELSGENITIASGSEASFTYQFITGAKVVNLLDNYEKQYNISNLDLAVDFGWLYFLTKPMYHLLTFLKNVIGNFALAILALTVLVKLIMFPLVSKSSSSMSGMKKLQPELERIKALYPDDAAKRNQAIMEVYKKNKINPAGGCLPLLIQMPVFFSLYKVLYISIEMRHTPFWGWVKDMSAPDPTTVFNLFGLIPWDPPSFLMIGLWPMIMGFTMWLQQRLTPQPSADPNMTKMMAFLPIFLTYLMSSFPAGLVIYWAWSNVLTIVQQLVLNRKPVVKA
ncbi:MAG: membrane protein insertase YidC [Candidatus Paracaedibacteraceae bacterium]|nr:membrane protein insertase YidC [Candidatus Paracaedibacteraceae bacterium]